MICYPGWCQDLKEAAPWYAATIALLILALNGRKIDAILEATLRHLQKLARQRPE